jgi:hypothetical protein
MVNVFEGTLMSPLKWSTTLIGVALAGSAFIWVALPSNKASVQTTPLQPMRPQAQGATLAPASVAGAASPQRVTRAVSMNYKKAFQSATDYWAFAQAILPGAKAGNAGAQYYLSRAMEQCDEDNRMYFQHKGQKLSLDEGLQFAVKRRLSIEIAQSVFDKCHGFQAGDLTELGSAPDWLAKATDAGQPLAEATTARKILTQDMLKNFAKAGGVPDQSTTVTVGNGADPRQLLRAAVKSGDPEVLFAIGDVQGLLYPADSDTNTTRFAWWLLACQRGFDCSGGADWVRNTCAGDPQCASASSPSDLVRSLAGDKWPAVQQRAQEISAKLAAGQWGELDLGL